MGAQLIKRSIGDIGQTMDGEEEKRNERLAASAAATNRRGLPIFK